jgi:spore coat protein U-like protein
MKARPTAVALATVGILLMAGGTARAACTITVNTVVFGVYDVITGGTLDTTGSVVFQCAKPDKRIRITLSTGSSGTYAYRTMRQGADIFRYNLYINGFTTVWGDGSGSTDLYTNRNPPDNVPVTVIIYGRIPAGQDPRAGAYSDTVQVQIDF